MLPKNLLVDDGYFRSKRHSKTSWRHFSTHETISWTDSFPGILNRTQTLPQVSTRWLSCNLLAPVMGKTHAFFHTFAHVMTRGVITTGMISHSSLLLKAELISGIFVAAVLIGPLISKKLLLMSLGKQAYILTFKAVILILNHRFN